MRTKASAKTPPPSRTHTVIIVLLMWVVALLVFGIGYMVYRDQSADAVDVAKDDTAMSCEERIDAALKSATTVESDVSCATTDSYAGTNGPSFSYPVDWEVFSQAVNGRASTVVYVNRDPVWLCDGCDGPLNDMTVQILPNTDGITLDAYVEKRYGTNNAYGYSGVTKGSAVINGTTVFEASGQFDGMGQGPFKEIVYVTEKTLVTVQSINWDNRPDVDAAWTVVRNSLDLSEVE